MNGIDATIKCDDAEKLPALVKLYAGEEQDPVRYRLPTWERALGAIPGGVTVFLRSDDLTRAPSWERYRAMGDRLVDRGSLKSAVTDLNLDGPDDAILQTFVLIIAWGSGTSNPRSLRYVPRALAAPEKAADVLRSTAKAMRAVKVLGEAQLCPIYKSFDLDGTGPAFFTKWFAFAGSLPERSWQPLILDARVYRTVNRTLDVRLGDLAAGRGGAARYATYVRVMHEWAKELSITAERLEWVMFQKRGKML